MLTLDKLIINNISAQNLVVKLLLKLYANILNINRLGAPNMYQIYKLLKQAKNQINNAFEEPESKPAPALLPLERVKTPPRLKPSYFCTEEELMARRRAEGRKLREKNKKSRELVKDKMSNRKR